MIIGHQLSLLCQHLHGTLFKNSSIVLQVSKNFGIQHHKAAVNHRAVIGRFLPDSMNHIVRANIKDSLLLSDINRGNGRNLSMTLVKLHQTV